jgi:transposase-like protein
MAFAAGLVLYGCAGGPMGKKPNRPYSPRFKFTVVLEVLKGEKPEAEAARACDVHPATR